MRIAGGQDLLLIAGPQPKAQGRLEAEPRINLVGEPRQRGPSRGGSPDLRHVLADPLPGGRGKILERTGQTLRWGLAAKPVLY
jgi:hypothetical protein